MSVSVTVHELGAPNVVPNPLSDLETVRKSAEEKLRIRRLVQVREQSKELAAKVRHNYQQAKEKELAKIEQTKREELKAWKRQHIRQLQDEYARCASEVGEAHKAAEAAEECAVWFEEKRATQQAVALQRGRRAEGVAAREREQKDTLREAKARRKPYVPSKSIAVQTADIPEPKLETICEAVPVASEDNSSTEPTPSPFEQFRSGRKLGGQRLPTVGHDSVPSESEDELYCPGTGDKENMPSGGPDYSATAFTSPSDFRPVEPPQRKRLQPFTQITELVQQRRQQQQQQHQRHDSAEDWPVQREPRATHKTSAGPYASYGTQKTVQFDDMSENTLSFPTSSAFTSDDGRPAARTRHDPPPLSDHGSPRKVRPRKLVDQPKVSPVQQDPREESSRGKAAAPMNGKRGQALLPTSGVAESSSSTTSYGASTKVQYYDYNTRYSKEYEQPVAFVQREERRTGNGPTAMEEADRYEKLQHELANARSKSVVDRTKPALEKQQTRKDYDKLSKELDHLTRSENKLKSLAAPTKIIPTEVTIKQKADARQRKANEAIENLLQQRALVTCPVVRSEKTSDHRSTRSRSAARAPVVNVAEMRPNPAAPPNHDGPGNNVSSDSCASIVLGTFERPGIPLPPDGAGAVDKIARMKELLEQINEQRQLLTEEIEKKEAQVPDNVEQLCANMQKDTELEKLERMKRRQVELVEQHRLLQKREREVEELERQLREKMALLRKNKQRDGEVAGKAAAVVPPHKRGQSGSRGTVPPAVVHVETKGQRDAIEVEVEQQSTASLGTTTTTSEDGANTYTGGRASSERKGEVPVKIIITVNDKSSTPSKRKHKKKAPKKRSPKAVPPPVTVPGAAPKATAMEQNPVEPEALPTAMYTVKTEAARKAKKVVSRAVVMDFSPGSTSTTSTVYRTLPPKIGSLKINSVLPPPPEMSPKPAVPDVPASEKPAGPKHQLLRKPVPRTGSNKNLREKPTTGGREANLNPDLVKYIVRLLGMSRQSIDQLGVSSTSLSTPNASVVNVSSNVVVVGGPVATVPVVPTTDEIERMARLRKFIDENYNFLQEIDETLKRSDQSTVGSDSRRDSLPDDADVSRVEDVWLRTLRSRERSMKQQVEKRGATIEQATVTVSKTKPRKQYTEQQANVPPPAPVEAPQRMEQVTSAPPAPAPVMPSLESNPPTNGRQYPAVPSNGQRMVVAREASLKSILKSPKKEPSPKVAKIITPQGHVEIINLSDREEQEILERYSQLTKRCSNRITELSQMIHQVREEKRRLIEDSLSSLDQPESSTKYMDLPVTLGGAGVREVPTIAQPPAAVVNEPAAGATGPSPSGGGIIQLDDPVSDEIDNIFSSKQIGLSKDSGIAMSRPLTASDIRESPSEDCSQAREPPPFEPFLRDIHKPATTVDGGASLRLVPPAASSTSLLQQVAHASSRKPPPVAIARYSPHQLDEVPAHELSTILEVDTPAAVAASTSKVLNGDVSSLSVAGERSDVAKELVLIEARNKLLLEPVSPRIGYDRFPNYDEYVRAEGRGGSISGRMDLENTGTGTAVHSDTGLRLDVTEEREPGRLQYRSFPGAAPPFDLTEDDAGSKVDQQSNGNNNQCNVSDGSLPDVVAELKKYDIILPPLNHSLDNSNRSTPRSEGAAGRPEPQPRPAADADGGGQRMAEPRGEPLDHQLSESLGRDLDSVAGLRWFSAMLRRTQEKQQQQQQDHSSSSSLSLPVEPTGRNTRRPVVAHDHTNNDDDDSLAGSGGSGKPPNLAKFISRELMVRTLSEGPSTSSELTSSSSHSALLRSLLSISNLEHTSNGSGFSPAERLLTPATGTGSRTNNNVVQRTSTPVASKSTASGGSSSRLDHAATDPGANRSDAFGNLFSGESRLSSVHSSSGDSGKHHHQQQEGLSVPGVRLERRSSVSHQEGQVDWENGN